MFIVPQHHCLKVVAFIGKKKERKEFKIYAIHHVNECVCGFKLRRQLFMLFCCFTLVHCNNGCTADYESGYYKLIGQTGEHRRKLAT